MENVQARKDELQGFIDSRKQQLAEGVSLSAQGVINSEITAFETEIAAIDRQAEREAAQQVRIQAQEEKVATITLPYDFNDLLSDEDYKNAQGQPHKITVANDMITEVVQGFQQQSYAEHNKEIEDLKAGHAEELLQLRRQNKELANQVDAQKQAIDQVTEQRDAVTTQINQILLEKKASDDARDAAVRDKEGVELLLTEKQAHIEKLRNEGAIGAVRAVNVLDISPTDKLAQMVKETTEQKANRAITRWSEMMPEVVAPPVVPAGPAVFQPEHTQAGDHPTELVHTADPTIPTQDGVTGHTFQVHSGDAMDPGVSSENGKSGEAVSRKEFEDLKGRVEQIERQANIRVA